MKNLLISEMVKLLHNKYVLFSLALTAVTMLLCLGLDVGLERIDGQIYYMSFVFLIVSCLVVGSIVSNEYSAHTFKELIIAGPSRWSIYVSKLIIVLAASSLLYALYAALFLLSNPHAAQTVDLLFLGGQYCAVLQQTAIIFCLAVMLRSFTAVAISTAVLLIMYREFLKFDNLTYPGKALAQTFMAQFMKVDVDISCVYALVLSLCVSGVVGYLVFRVQEIS